MQGAKWRLLVRADLDDIQGNTKDGIHAASMAGSWMSLVYGSAGMRLHEGNVSFAPILPQDWQGYRFRINIRARLIEVTVQKSGTSFLLLQGSPLTIYCNNQQYDLVEKQIIVVSNQELPNEGKEHQDCLFN